jgi:hypothetical protein
MSEVTLNCTTDINDWGKPGKFRGLKYLSEIFQCFQIQNVFRKLRFW